MSTPFDQAAAIKAAAKALGFDLVGIAPVGPSARAEYLRAWLADGRHGEMHYIAGRFDERTDLNTYFPGVKSAICVAVNYNVDRADSPDQEIVGKVARYAWGGDYHIHLKDRVCDLADWIRKNWPGTRTKIGCDTVPVLEKELAVRAGIGWMGKNTCVIHPLTGSWLLLGEVLTTLELPADQPGIDRCGTCTRCLDACPTRAITAPYQLDARKCISYLTIEHRGDIDSVQQTGIGDWLFGCDICQDVCPFNGKAPLNFAEEVRPRFPGGTLDAAEILRADDDTLRLMIRNTAFKRIKLPVLRRNAETVVSNYQLAKTHGAQTLPGT